jgi:orotate phosphoribosyltransferase
VRAREGHFRLESGYHSDSWLELDRLFQRPSALAALVTVLAAKIMSHQPDLVCGPLTGGALLAQLIASERDLEFAFAERIVTDRAGLFPVDYRLPAALGEVVRGKRVAVVDDAISAGSAVRATLADLDALGAQPVVLAALMVIGDRPMALARERMLPLAFLVQLPNNVWAPAECPMCALAAPLTEL